MVAVVVVVVTMVRVFGAVTASFFAGQWHFWRDPATLGRR